MMKARMYALPAVLMGLALFGRAHALESFAATPQELALCASFHGGISGHFCDCVRFRYRAVKKIGDKNAFSFNLNEAIDGCNYVLRATSPNDPLRKRVHLEKGRALKLRGDTGPAAQEFQRAIELDPREINAYLELSELQRALGSRSQALETAALGLRHNPNTKSLQKLYLELGGKQPFPQPVARVEPVPEKKGAEPQVPQAEELPPVEPVVRVDAPADATLEPHHEPGEADGENAGRACRFCPPEEIQRRWVESFKSSPEKKPGE